MMHGLYSELDYQIFKAASILSRRYEINLSKPFSVCGYLETAAFSLDLVRCLDRCIVYGRPPLAHKPCFSFQISSRG